MTENKESLSEDKFANLLERITSAPIVNITKSRSKSSFTIRLSRASFLRKPINEIAILFYQEDERESYQLTLSVEQPFSFESKKEFEIQEYSGTPNFDKLEKVYDNLSGKVKEYNSNLEILKNRRNGIMGKLESLGIFF